MARAKLEDESEPNWLDSGESSGQSTQLYEKKKHEPKREEIRTSSREELIECIKRGQKPTWVPKPNLQALCEEENALHEKSRGIDEKPDTTSLRLHNIGTAAIIPSGLPLDIYTSQHDPIVRPPSALHRGDFSERSVSSLVSHSGSEVRSLDPFASPLANYELSTPWPQHGFSLNTFKRTVSGNLQLNTKNESIPKLDFRTRRRAPSAASSLSSSFVMRIPTSPLVNATTHDYLDLEDGEYKKSTTKSADHVNRRRTMPPNSFHSLSMSLAESAPPNFSRPLPSSLRRENSMPEHSHQPRRSLSSFTYQPKSNPSSPVPRGRRASGTSETNMRRRSSMVGSFEESILRGRMSTPPSKPLNFVAQIGVMGRGDCSSSLKCPAHVTVPFPAVFYNYDSTTASRSSVIDAPSPYVGNIDLENSLEPITVRIKSKTSKRNGKAQAMERDINGQGHQTPAPTFENGHHAHDLKIGGAYRVPKQGQLQIIIKNPNKTAVKLFLIPYDLTGMEAGNKTFVRQRSFSSGPIVDIPIADKSVSPSPIDPLEEKQILRYLVHVKFCCPAKDRFYLFSDIRVVFANRVPDGKEKLRNEIQLPDPKYSPFKPTDMTIKPPKLSMFNGSTSDKYAMSALPGKVIRDLDQLDGIDSISVTNHLARSPEDIPSENQLHRKNGPFTRDTYPAFSHSGEYGSRIPYSSLVENGDANWTISPVTGFKAYDRNRTSPIPWNSSNGSSTIRSYSPAPAEPGDGLLSRKFRELGKQGNSLSKLLTNEGLMKSSSSLKQHQLEDMSRDGDIGLAHTFYIRNDHDRD